jgi:ectoine hydroxylase-related dioxygenase (phytanoyl-CoA dioxygenase family)
MSERNELERRPFGTDVSEIASIIARNGGLILTGALTRDQVAAVNADLDVPFGVLPEGNYAEEDGEAVAEFWGHRTKRLVHTLRYSKTWREDFLASPILAQYVAAVVPGEAGSHAYVSSHAVEIHPGEKAQELHRDGSLFELVGFNKDGLNVSVTAIVAMTDVTEEMGATRVIPGSHLWDDFSAPGSQEQTSPALLGAGDLLFYNTKLMHGGGANTTKNRSRRIITTGFTLPFFMGLEAWPFALPWEEVRHYPKQVQAGLGFRSPSSGGEQPGSMWRVEYLPLEEMLEQSAIAEPALTAVL